jgi:hypothetical protein
MWMFNFGLYAGTGQNKTIPMSYLKTMWMSYFELYAETAGMKTMWMLLLECIAGTG